MRLHLFLTVLALTHGSPSLTPAGAADKLLYFSNTSALADAVGEPVAGLDDIAIDTPMAPKLLGGLVAALIIDDALAATFIADSAVGVEDTMYRREYVAAIFKELKARGKKGAAAYAADGGVDVAGLLAGDPEFDSPLAEFLEKSGLKELA